QCQSSSILHVADVTREPCGDALGESVVWDVARHDGARADQGMGADGNAAEDDRSGPDGRAALDAGRDDRPVGVALQAAGGGRARVAVVDEEDAMTDADLVLDGDAFADEAVRGDFAASANAGVFLDLDEGADLGVVADGAAVEVDEGSVVDLHPLAKLDVRRY